MTPDERQRLERVEALLAELVRSDRYTVGRLIQMNDGRNIQTGRTTGTKIGTATDQKIGFYGVTPVDQPATVSKPTVAGVDQDADARTAVNAVIDRLREIGIIA